jgi:hypothetical protein
MLHLLRKAELCEALIRVRGCPKSEPGQAKTKWQKTVRSIMSHARALTFPAQFREFFAEQVHHLALPGQRIGQPDSIEANTHS